MVHDDKVTDEVADVEMETPPPNPPCPLEDTKVAMLPVMVQDDKVTVPPLMKTPPPPCKLKHKSCENPIGAMVIFAGKAGTYPSLVEQDWIPNEWRESNWACQQGIPMRAMGTFQGF